MTTTTIATTAMRILQQTVANCWNEPLDSGVE